ncbi:MAG: type II secretion system protein GspD [Candidatus Omnitrophica bacterium]|nr:type II secretion system protein GspD [Candidatus Omnitrophota bacterium]
MLKKPLLISFTVSRVMFIITLTLAAAVFSIRPSAGQDAPAAAPAPAIEKGGVIDLLDFNQVEITDVLKLISQKVQRNIAATQNVKGLITVYLKNITIMDALKVIADSYGWAFVEDAGIIKFMTNQEYEERYGQKFGLNQKTLVYHLNFVKPPEILNILSQIKTQSGKILADEKSGTLIIMDTPQKSKEMEDIIKNLDTVTKTEVFVLNYSKASEISEKINEYLTPSLGQQKVDQRTSRILVTDKPQVLDKIRAVVQAFDQKHKEVLIQAKILQIVLDHSHQTGVDWEAIVAGFQNLDFKGSFSILGATDKRGKIAIGSLSDNDFQVMIEALETVGKTNVLASPRITAVSGEEAKILVGTTKPYVTTTTTTPSSGPTTTAESVNFIDVGVKLYVTPTINNDGFITMKVKPEVSSATGQITTSNNNTIPVVDTSTAETTVMIRDGVTIIIGGLIKEENVSTKKRVPILGAIPLLGMAFRNETESITKTELAIFLKPIIISGDAQVKDDSSDAK